MTNDEQMWDELDDFFHEVEEIAVQLLAEIGELYPFGALLDAEREVTQVPFLEPDAEDASDPDPERMMETGMATLRTMTAGARALGMCYLTSIELNEGEEPVDALCAHLEHASGMAIQVYEPLTEDSEGNLELGDPIITQVEPEIFRVAPGEP